MPISEFLTNNIFCYDNFFFIKLFIHNSSYLPLTDVDGISLSTGYETNVKVSQTFYKKLPAPYGECIEDAQSILSFDSDLYRSSVSLTSTYSQKFCLQVCIQELIINMCGCYDLYLPQTRNSNVSACDWNYLNLCVSKVYEFYMSSDSATRCLSDCPVECESVDFNLDISYATFPTPFYAYLLDLYQTMHPELSSGRTLSYNSDILKKSVMAVNVYYDDISFNIIEESPAMTQNQLIGNIGGKI